jgi:hypothetical protein
LKAIKWLLLFYFAHFNAQVNVKFVEHLSLNSLQTEHSTYLSALPASDSTAYFRAKFYLQYFNDSLFLKNYFQSPQLCNADKLLLHQADVIFLNRSGSEMRRKWFAQRDEKNVPEEIALVYQASEDPHNYKTGDFPEPLREDFTKYRRIYKKKPVYGALLSTAVPGLGKLYAGKPASFIFAFVINACYAAQTVESAVKLGDRHPLTLINLSAFTIFYVANIYGGYHSVKDLKRERKKQFLKDAAAFYN